MTQDLIYFGFVDDVPIFIDTSIKKGEGYIVDLSTFYIEEFGLIRTDKGIIGLINL